MTKTAEEYRASAAAHKAAKEESFRRSDTDGFLSQWASGLSAQLDRARADILDDGGKAEFIGLYEGDRRVRARMVTFPDRHRGYGEKTMWLLHEDEAELRERRGGKWLPIGRRSRVLKALGLRERPELDDAWAKIAGRGRGLSGTAWVAVFRTGNSWGDGALLVPTGDEAEALEERSSC